MADLRVLDQQQKESHRKLEMTRSLKQRRSEYHQSLQDSLRQYKYQHGRQRADLQRMRENLSTCQRELLSSREKVSGAEDDLHSFHGLLKTALETKRRISFHYRTKVSGLSALEQKLRSIQDAEKKAEIALESANAAQESLLAQESSQRQALREHQTKLQAVSAAITSARKGNSQLEHDLHQHRAEEEKVKQHAASIQKQIKQQETQMSVETEVVHKRKAQALSAIQDYGVDIEHEREVLNVEETHALSIVMNTLSILQKSENQASSGDNAVADYLVNAKKSEEMALCEEKVAVCQMQARLDALDKQLDQLESEEKACKTTFETLSKDVLTAKEAEDERASINQKAIQEYSDAKESLAEKEGTLVERKKAHEQKVAALREELGTTAMSIFNAKVKVEEATASLQLHQEQVAAAHKALNDMKHVCAGKTDKLEHELATKTEARDELAAEANRAEAEAGQKGPECSSTSSLETLQEHITNMLEGMRR